MSIDTKFIGKTYPAYTYEVGKEKIKEYAKAIKNPDPHFMDDAFAKKSPYGTIIAPPPLPWSSVRILSNRFFSTRN